MSKQTKPEAANRETSNRITNEGGSSMATPTERSGGRHRDTDIAEVAYQATPTIRPTLIWIFLVLGATAALVLAVTRNPESFGGPDTANVIANAILLLAALAEVRLLVRIYVLSKTEYTITADTIHHEYAFLLRRYSRRVPLARVRSSALRQSPIQNLLGYGTIVVNQGLGGIELEHVPNPDDAKDLIQRYSARPSEE